MSGHVKTLPFTGFATLPLAALGLALSGIGLLMAKVRPSRDPA
jgi:hypothetical protein